MEELKISIPETPKCIDGGEHITKLVTEKKFNKTKQRWMWHDKEQCIRCDYSHGVATASKCDFTENRQHIWEDGSFTDAKLGLMKTRKCTECSLRMQAPADKVFWKE